MGGNSCLALHLPRKAGWEVSVHSLLKRTVLEELHNNNNKSCFFFSKPPQAPSPIKVTTSHLVLATLEAPSARRKGRSLRTRSCTRVWELRRLTLEKFEEKGQLGLVLRSSFHQGLSCKSPLFSPRNTRLALPLTGLRVLNFLQRGHPPVHPLTPAQECHGFSPVCPEV